MSLGTRALQATVGHRERDAALRHAACAAARASVPSGARSGARPRPSGAATRLDLAGVARKPHERAGRERGLDVVLVELDDQPRPGEAGARRPRGERQAAHGEGRGRAVSCGPFTDSVHGSAARAPAAAISASSRLPIAVRHGGQLGSLPDCSTRAAPEPRLRPQGRRHRALHPAVRPRCTSGDPIEREVSGFADPAFRLSVNLLRRAGAHAARSSPTASRT